MYVCIQENQLFSSIPLAHSFARKHKQVSSIRMKKFTLDGIQVLIFILLFALKFKPNCTDNDYQCGFSQKPIQAIAFCKLQTFNTQIKKK